MSKNEKKFFRQCPDCDKQIGHTHHSNRDKAVKLNRLCGPCASRKRQTGVIYSAEGKANMTAAQKGKTVSAETRAKISSAKKGKTLTAEHRANLSSAKQKIRDANTEMYGEQHKPNRHNLTKWSKQIKERDNYTCARCNTVATGNFINAHHVVPKEYFPDQVLDISNGITLCRSCHNNIHGDLDRITLEGTKLTPVGFQEHAARFIAEGKASSQTTQNPHGYKPVFKTMITSHKE